MDVGSLTAGAVTNTMMVFIAFMPSPDEVAETGTAHGVRINEVASVAVSVGLGIALSILGRDGKPLAGAITASIALVAGFEYLARTTDERIITENNRRNPNARI